MTRHQFAGFRDGISKWETPQLNEKPATLATEVDLETLRKQAQDKGYQDGHAKGLAQAEKEVAKRLASMDALLVAMAQPFHDINERTLDALARLAGKIARCLVKRELHTAPEAIMALVRDTVAILGSGSERIHVHLNPVDAALVQDLARSSSEKSLWDLVEDPLIARGDCRVTSRDSLVDGTLLARINTIITQFQGDERV